MSQGNSRQSSSFTSIVNRAMNTDRISTEGRETTQTPSAHVRPSERLRNRTSTSSRSESPNHTRVLPEQEILEQNGIDLKSLSIKAAEELSNRPKNGVIYDDEVAANLKSTKIKMRLKQLSMNNQTFSIDQATEISDAACLLRLLRKPNHEIELAGQMAHSGALLMIQAKLLARKGQELLDQSKRKLQSTDF